MLQGSPSTLAAIARAARSVGRVLTHGARLHLDLLLPPQCLACRQPMERTADSIFLCGDCRSELAPRAPSQCMKCGASAVQAAVDCPWCRRHHLQFDAVVPLGRYRDRLRRVVLQMKQPQHEPLSWSMGRLLAHARRDALGGLRADLVVAIPMHWTRRFMRAVNSPDVLAACVAAELGIPLQRTLLRTRNTKLQRELRVEDRFRNLRGAFNLRPGYDLGGARVLLVDDILTTGATANAAAMALRAAGAAAVAVAVLARAEGSGSL